MRWVLVCWVECLVSVSYMWAQLPQHYVVLGCSGWWWGDARVCLSVLGVLE
jgi:hypothetical protein